MPRFGTSVLDISAISREMLCDWLFLLAASSPAAPGVSIRLTMGSDRLANSAMLAAACKWCSGIHSPLRTARFWAMKPTRRSAPSKSSTTTAA